MRLVSKIGRRNKLKCLETDETEKSLEIEENKVLKTGKNDNCQETGETIKCLETAEN